MADREWKTDQLEKFADVQSPQEYKNAKVRRHLPATQPYRQDEGTPDLEMRREVDPTFRIKRVE